MTRAKTHLKFYFASALWIILFIAGMLSIHAAANGLPYRNLFFGLLADVARLLY